MEKYYLMQEIYSIVWKIMSDSKEEEESIIFESQIEDLSKQAIYYQSLDNTEKIQNITLYNSLIELTAEYEGVLDVYKTRLEDINGIKKKKVAYNNKTFTDALSKISKIRQKIDEKEATSLDELLVLYEELKTLQMKIVPYLETKKLEIVKI